MDRLLREVTHDIRGRMAEMVSMMETLNVLSGNDIAKDIRIMNNMEGVATLFLDKKILGMVLCNIVKNAVKMASSVGFISIQTHQIGQKVIVTIRDTGINIGIDKAKTLFRKANLGFTAATDMEKVTMPGVLILKEFVQSGEIQRVMDSITRKDSTFYFCLSSGHEANGI
jgi:signal transduction histidine kinase